MTTTQSLQFRTVPEVAGRYRADGQRFTYTVTKTTGQWMLELHEQNRSIEGLILKGDRLGVTFTDTARLAKAIAKAHEALGEGYRSCDHGYANRMTCAINIAYDAEAQAQEARWARI